ncbi:glycosyl hydrolase family 61-domain-containing protein [Mariannaea sp. PMI_226]|nr:glycosyl hydrolase family 61-domain-containing protein [Mariannaea sp. PMI_226]
MFKSSASGPGWFKIWEDGYNVEKETWCVDTLRANNGHLTIDLPTGLPSGYYLVRPEVLALHNAVNGDPQFYAGCAQIFIENGPDIDLEIPDKYNVSIPGYVNKDDAALTFNIYEKPLGKYPMPGPEVYIPTSKDVGEKHAQEDGVCPKECLAKNANWCGKALDNYSDQEGCWAAAKDCWDQSKGCWDSAPPSGYQGCTTWNNYCTKINDRCSAKNYDGLPNFDLSEVNADVPGPIPKPYGSFKATPVGGSSEPDDSTPSSPSSTKPTTSKQPPSKETSTAHEAPSSTDEVSSKATETAYIPPQQTTSSSSGLKVSEDGRCGGTTGQTCEGSTFGNCCSKKGRCGRKTRHCSCGCQSAFGQCD